MDITVNYINNSEEKTKIELIYFNNNIEYKREINLDSKSIYKYTDDNTSVAFDFLIFSIIIYNIDCLISRYIHSCDGWRRDLNIKIPLNNYKLFDNSKYKLEKMVSFLTGDIWKFQFVSTKDVLNFFEEKKKNECALQNIKKVCLFSGGLDSLTGVVDLLNTNENILLCSHYGKFEKQDQNDIKEVLKKNGFINYDNIQIFCRLAPRRKGSSYEVGEGTYRSRSLLFLGIATYLSYNVSEECEIIMPENGTISLNLPLSKSRRGSCSTRTTHPTMINMLQGILTSFGIKNKIQNPFEFKTKGELVKELYNKELIDKELFLTLINKSVSCGKRGHKTHRDENKRGAEIKHCGICMPCIYRRVALHIINEDNKEDYGRDIFTSKNFFINEPGNDSADDFRALLHFLNKNYSINEIENELVICGINDFFKLNEYAQVVQRTIHQIKEWLAHNQKKDIDIYINNHLENLK